MNSLRSATPRRRLAARVIAANAVAVSSLMGSLAMGSLAMGSSVFAAQPKPSGASAAKAPATAGAKPADAKSPSTTDKARATARKATAAAGAAAAATATTLALASDEQRHAFSLAHLGEYQCEFKRMIRVLAHPKHEGYVDLYFDKQVVTARPVLSSTGAVRLEDVKGRYLMVQIAFKSMLMDTKISQRVADECQHDAHHEARRAAAEAPPAEGLGIAGPSSPSSSAGPTAPTTPAAAPKH